MLRTVDSYLNQEIGEGYVYSRWHFNDGNLLDLSDEEEYPLDPDYNQRLSDIDWDYYGSQPIRSYGVCDSPEQFIEDFHGFLEDHEKELMVCFSHVAKVEQPSEGGWRWHKWGSYVGHGEPECEYLYDEEGFEEGVYCFHVYDISGVE